MPDGLRLRVATYNIHRARGLDGRDRLDRIVDVLGEVDAAVVALQEVFLPQAEALVELTGMHGAFGPTRRLPRGLYGNLCLSRLPLASHRRYNLTCGPFEPRGCLRADVDLHAGHGGGHGAHGFREAGRPARLHVFNVHLGLRYRERVHQARMLARILAEADLSGPRLVLGDFNEWFHGAASRLLRAELGPPCGRRRGARTHPSPLPVFPLDRIYLDSQVPHLEVERVGVHRSRLARVASDHLPTYADLRLPALPDRAHAGRA